MRKKLKSQGRRRFLKYGIFGSIVAISSIKEIFSSDLLSRNSNQKQNKDQELSTKRIQSVLMKYGGEFAGIKPGIRR